MAALLCLIPAPTLAAAAEGRWETAIPENAAGWTSSALFPDGTGYIANGSGRIYKTPDSGSTWLPLPEPGLSSGVEISFASPELGYGVSGTGIYKTSDGALTWETVEPPPGPSDVNGGRLFLDGISSPVGTEDVIVTGWTTVGGEDGCAQRRSKHYIARSSDEGTTWTVSRLGVPASTYEIEQLDAMSGLLLVHRFGEPEGSCNAATIRTEASVVLLTRNGGRSFTKIHTASLVDEDPVMSVAMPTADRIVLGTRGGRILLSNDGGKRFRVVAEVTAGALSETRIIDSLAFGNRRIGYAGTNGTGVWRTADGGRTWTQEESPFGIGYEDGLGLQRGSIAAAGSSRAIAIGPGAIARRAEN